MQQTVKESWIESVLNVASGFVISYIVWLFVVAPLFNLPMSTATDLAIVSIFTITSLVRSYLWRRFFNAGMNRLVHEWVNARVFPDLPLIDFDYSMSTDADYRSKWRMMNSDRTEWVTTMKYTEAEARAFKCARPIYRTL